MKHLAFTLLLTILVSGLLQLGITIAFGWPATPWPVEVLSHPRGTFAEEARRAIFFSPRLAEARLPMIVIVGASGSQEGFQPSMIQTDASDIVVHNFALGGANISEFDQIVELVLKATSPQILSKSVLVVAVSYANFVPDKKRWRDPVYVPPDAIAQGVVLSDIEREAMRCPGICDPSSLFFKLAPGWLISASKNRYALFLPLASRLPAHLGDPLLHWELWRYDPRKMFHPKRPRKLESDAANLAAEPYLVMAHKQMHHLTEFMGKPEGVVQDEQFDKLRSLIDKAKASGLHVIVVDMPLPSWHRQKSPFFAPYEVKLHAVLANYHGPGAVDLVSLADAIPDDQFRDSVHPKAEAANHWAKVLMERLSALPVRQTDN